MSLVAGNAPNDFATFCSTQTSRQGGSRSFSLPTRWTAGCCYESLTELRLTGVQGCNVQRESVADPRPGEVDGQALAHLCKQCCHWRRPQRGGGKIIYLDLRDIRTEKLLSSTELLRVFLEFLIVFFLVQGVEWLTGQIKDGMDGKR